jgi:hypothetical protein
MDQQLLDRAAEWVGVNHPELDGLEFDIKVCEVAEQLMELDDVQDQETP